MPLLPDGFEINKLTQILNNNYNNYMWHNNMVLLSYAWDADTLITTNSIKCHHYLAFLDNEQKNIEYCNFIWNNTTHPVSMVMYQLLCHRTHDKHGYTPLIMELFDETIKRAKNQGAHRWVASGHFFKAMYSKNIEPELVELLEPLEIDVDCVGHKMTMAVSWLLLFGSEKTVELTLFYLAHLDEQRKEIIFTYLEFNINNRDNVVQLLFGLNLAEYHYFYNTSLTVRLPALRS